MALTRRTFGKWQLYTSSPATLGVIPYGNGFIYHIKLADLSTEAGRMKWLKQISEKPTPYDLPGLEKAIVTLLSDGTIEGGR